MRILTDKSKVKSRKSKFVNGFTLIELLIVIIIIGILATLTFISYSSADKQARDAQRKNDITQYRNLLQQYAIAHGATYPSTTGTVGAWTECTTLAINPCLNDPMSGSNPYNDGGPTLNYWYISDGQNYVLYSRLEAGTTKYWEACSTGRSGVVDSSSASVGVPPLAATDCAVQ